MVIVGDYEHIKTKANENDDIVENKTQNWGATTDKVLQCGVINKSSVDLPDKTNSNRLKRNIPW